MTSIHKTKDESDFRLCCSGGNTVLVEERGERIAC